MQWDLLIRGAKVFDGSGGAGRMLDIAVRDGRIAALGTDLPEAAAKDVHDATGSWLTPGLLDIHTHEDLEVELEPGLPEVVRHGTTTSSPATAASDSRSAISAMTVRTRSSTASPGSRTFPGRC